VLAAFPLWVSLRNDADLRAGLKDIRVADVVRRQLPVPYAEDDFARSGAAETSGASAPGTVTATRVHRRPSQPATTTAPTTVVTTADAGLGSTPVVGETYGPGNEVPVP
jgi:hypothetical protein